MAFVDANPNNANKKLKFKNCTLFEKCITEINNALVDNGQDIGIVMLVYNLIEYCDNYSKTSGN